MKQLLTLFVFITLSHSRPINVAVLEFKTKNVNSEIRTTKINFIFFLKLLYGANIYTHQLLGPRFFGKKYKKSKLCFGPKSRRQGTYLDDFLMDFRQIASGVRFRRQNPQIRPNHFF